MPDCNRNPLSYRDAGVDIDAGHQLINHIKPLVKRTLRPEVLSSLGGFGALFAMPSQYQQPVLVSSTDGVGTKLKLAFALNQHHSIGIDLVAMSVNDIIVQGAEPLFFLDYFACGKLDVTCATQVITGIAQGCEQAGCALIGGETAEMPDMYPPGEYDLAGFAVGVVERTQIIDGSHVNVGDQLLGLGSNGAHANGYALLRKILQRSGTDLQQPFQGEQSLAEVIMAPTRIYVKPLLALMAQVPVKALAHITGGGIIDNLPRVLPEQVCATIDSKAWVLPPLFTWLQQQGQLSDFELRRTFNCGIGMMVVVAANDCERAIQLLRQQGETVYHLGDISKRRPQRTAVNFL